MYLFDSNEFYRKTIIYIKLGVNIRYRNYFNKKIIDDRRKKIPIEIVF